MAARQSLIKLKEDKQGSLLMGKAQDGRRLTSWKKHRGIKMKKREDRTLAKTVKINKEELTRIQEAAREIGLDFSSFLRNAALEKARQINTG